METYKHSYMDASFSPNMETTAGQCTHEECTVHEQSTSPKKQAYCRCYVKSPTVQDICFSQY